MSNLFSICNKCRVIIENNEIVNFDETFFNMTCNKWRSSIARRLVDNITPDLGYAKYIAIWDGNTPTDENNTILTNEIRREPIKTPDTVLDNNIVKVYARFPRGFSATINEAGLFIDNTATSINGTGNLLARSVFDTPITKQTEDVLTIEWTVSVVNVVV